MNALVSAGDRVLGSQIIHGCNRSRLASTSANASIASSGVYVRTAIPSPRSQ